MAKYRRVRDTQNKEMRSAETIRKHVSGANFQSLLKIQSILTFLYAILYSVFQAFTEGLHVPTALLGTVVNTREIQGGDFAQMVLTSWLRK